MIKRLVRQDGGVGEAPQANHRRGVEHAPPPNLLGRSQPSIQRLVDVRAQRGRVQVWQASSPCQEALGGQRWTRERPQLGDGLPGARDRDLLPARSAVDDIAAVVTKVTDAHGVHLRLPVSHVIQMVARSVSAKPRSVLSAIRTATAGPCSRYRPPSSGEVGESGVGAPAFTRKQSRRLLRPARLVRAPDVAAQLIVVPARTLSRYWPDVNVPDELV